MTSCPPTDFLCQGIDSGLPSFCFSPSFLLLHLSCRPSVRDATWILLTLSSRTSLSSRSARCSCFHSILCETHRDIAVIGRRRLSLLQMLHSNLLSTHELEERESDSQQTLLSKSLSCCLSVRSVLTKRWLLHKVVRLQKRIHKRNNNFSCHR